MSLLQRTQVIFAKAESTYATDPTIADTDAVLTSNLNITPLDGPTVGRNLNRNVLGNDAQLRVGSFVTVSFDVELAGSGTAGTAPAYSALLLACGMAETVVASTSVTYDPVSTSFGSVWLEYEMGGQQHIIKGARGTFGMSANPAKYLN